MKDESERAPRDTSPLPEGGWLPTETLPREIRPVLIANTDGGVALGWTDRVGFGWTHWMPPPAPPGAAAAPLSGAVEPDYEALLEEILGTLEQDGTYDPGVVIDRVRELIEQFRATPAAHSGPAEGAE